MADNPQDANATQDHGLFSRPPQAPDYGTDAAHGAPVDAHIGIGLTGTGHGWLIGDAGITRCACAEGWERLPCGAVVRPGDARVGRCPARGGDDA